MLEALREHEDAADFAERMAAATELRPDRIRNHPTDPSRKMMSRRRPLNTAKCWTRRGAMDDWCVAE